MNRTSLPHLILILIAAGLVAVASPLAAQEDLSGSWTMETDAGLPGEEEPCVYSGDCQMQQDGSLVTGTVDLALVSGPDKCPPEMTATVDGSLDGEEVFGTLSSPVYGQASFSGAPTNSWTGSFLVVEDGVEENDFEGGSGTWLAERLSVLEIPTLSSLGLTALVLMLLAGGASILRA